MALEVIKLVFTNKLNLRNIIESNKKNLQFFIFENIVYYIKIFLKSLDSSENEAYTLTLKYDIYVSDLEKNKNKITKKIK